MNKPPVTLYKRRIPVAPNIVRKPLNPNKKYLKAVGAPFEISSSSCHVRKPKSFEWTDQDGSHPTVIIDNEIYAQRYLNGVPNKYAWVCESMAVKNSVNVSRLLSDTRIHKSYKKIFISDTTLLDKIPNSEFCFAGSNLPWVDILNAPPEKTKVCSMVSSSKAFTKGHQVRLDTALKLKEHLDLYGGAHGSPRIGYENKSKDGHGDKSPTIYPYMFSVVVENAQYPDYFTEKITDCFAGFTIPVYWGCPTISKFFDERGIIKLTDDFNIKILTKDLYLSMLPYAVENNKIIGKMTMADDYLYERITRHG